MADVALDDYIKTKHISRSGRGRRSTLGGRGRGGTQRQTGGIRRGASFGGGVTKAPARRSGGQNFSRTPPSAGKNRWQHDLYGAGFTEGLRSRGAGPEGGSKLLISNLEYGVSDSDIRDLFSEFGVLKNASVHYDRSGRSIGTAEVVYVRPGDAVAAFRKYNGVPLDGQAMDIQLVTAGVDAAAGGFNQGRVGGSSRVGNRSNNTWNEPRPRAGRGARGGRGGGANRGGGGGQKRGPKAEVTQEQLDMELDEYQSSTNMIA